MNRTDLRALYESVPEATQRFDPAKVGHLPVAVQRYLMRAIAPGTPLASAVRLRMHGALRLSRWRAFKAEQVMVRGRGMIWRARVRMGRLVVRGFDRYLDQEGAMLWTLLRIVPIVRARGRDVTRSAADRFAAESIWLPSRFCLDPVSWRVAGEVLHARFTVDGRNEDLALTTSAGSLQSVAMKRWGNPEGRPFRAYDFGALIEQEARFGGYTIPGRVRVGWHFGSARFDAEGEFFRATIDDATFR